MSQELKLKITCEKRVLRVGNQSNSNIPDNVPVEKINGIKRRSCENECTGKLTKRLKNGPILNGGKTSASFENLPKKSSFRLPVTNKVNEVSDEKSLNHKNNSKPGIENTTASPCIVSINETYQLGYTENTNDAEIYIFDFVDGLEVSYPVTVNSTDSLPEHLPPLFTETGYAEQLMALATNALENLAIRIDQWLCACQEAADANFIWRNISVHNASSSLRRQIFTLLSALVLDIDISEGFDCTSPDVDNLLYRLICQLSSDSTKAEKMLYEDMNTPSTAIPFVSLCHEPEHCLRVLRERILTLLHLLLPQLNLPSSFNPETDLPDLIDAVYSYNPQNSDT